MSQTQQNFIHWSHVAEGGKTAGATGLIAEGVAEPFVADVRNNGDWRLWHYSAGDKVQVLARGRARNVTTAQHAVERAAVKHIPELKADTEGEALATRQGNSKAVNALRVWLLTALTVASALWLVVFMALHRPIYLLRFALLFALIVTLTQLLLKWVDNEVKRVDRLSQRALAATVKTDVKKGGKR
jgi:hypothetical protein